MVACRIIASAPVPVPFLWTLDFGFKTWIWDLGLLTEVIIDHKATKQTNWAFGQTDLTEKARLKLFWGHQHNELSLFQNI